MFMVTHFLLSYAEYNYISNITELGQEAYQMNMMPYYKAKKNDFQPFLTLPNVIELYVNTILAPIRFFFANKLYCHDLETLDVNLFLVLFR